MVGKSYIINLAFFSRLSKLSKGRCHGLDSPLFVALALRSGLQYRHSDFLKFIRDDMATLCLNSVNFGPVTPEFTKVKGIHPVVFFFKINITDKLSQDPTDQFSPRFHHMVDI